MSVGTREELVEELKKYESLLSSAMYDYLNSLLELEFSVVRDHINNDERSKLLHLDVYKQIAKYNIWNRAMNLLKKSEPGCELDIQTAPNSSCAFIKDSGQYGKLFSLRNRGTDIEEVDLFQTMQNDELIKETIEAITYKLNGSNRPKQSFVYRRATKIGGKSSNEKILRDQDKQKLRETLALLKSGLTDYDKREINITERFYQLLMGDYGLNEEDFVKPPSILSEDRLTTTSYKTYTKCPGLVIGKTTKYVGSSNESN